MIHIQHASPALRAMMASLRFKDLARNTIPLGDLFFRT